MFQRDIFPDLKEHLASPQATVITGMRRTGKSTALKWLLEQVKHSNKIYMDCERLEVRAQLRQENYEAIMEWFSLKGLDLSKPCVIAFDEIQLVSNLPSLIKYIYDTYNTKFLVTGSSSYYMKNQFSESLAGRKRIFELYPLSFKEFLLFKQSGIKSLEKYSWKKFSAPWYERCKALYEEYLHYGGFPEVALQIKIKDKREYLNDIIDSYIALDVKLISDYSVSDDLYRLAKLLAARAGNKVDYSKLGSVAGINRQKLKEYIHLFEYTYFIYVVTPFSKNIDKEISQQPKLYFADTGILNELAGVQLSSGQLFENAIAAQLKPQGVLNYYQKKTGQEIDFIWNEKTAIEVKETALEQDLAVLKQRSQAIGLQDYALITRYVSKTKFRNLIWGGNVY
ncbi:MAG: ATP-binding protein [Bacteroidota bacterium]